SQSKNAQQQSQRTEQQADRRDQSEDAAVVRDERLGVFRGGELLDDAFFFLVTIFLVAPRSPSLRSRPTFPILFVLPPPPRYRLIVAVVGFAHAASKSERVLQPFRSRYSSSRLFSSRHSM